MWLELEYNQLRNSLYSPCSPFAYFATVGERPNKGKNKHFRVKIRKE